MRLLLFLLFLFFLGACSHSLESNEKNHYDLPQMFPLKSGIAWSYQTTFFLPDSNRVRRDTLYILGEYGDAFKMTYHPEKSYAIVKNDQNKLIILGEVSTRNVIDTTIYQTPYIWTFFNIDTGFVAKSVFDNYYCTTDSVHISIVHNVEFMNNLYDVYVVRFYLKNSLRWYEHIISVDGLMRERHYEGDELKSERIIQSKFEKYFQTKN